MPRLTAEHREEILDTVAKLQAGTHEINADGDLVEV